MRSKRRKRVGKRGCQKKPRRGVKKVKKALTLDKIEHIYESNIDC